MSPTTLLWALVGLAISLGALLVLLGAQQRAAGSPDASTRRRSRLRAAGATLTRREQVTVAAAAALGLIIAITTGWVVALLALPVGTLLISRILLHTAPSRIADLEALQEWTRNLSGVLQTNAGLVEALVLTLRSTPAPIRPQVERLVARLQANRPAPEALRAFADDLDDPAGDLIASTLLLGVTRSGVGLTQILKALADSVAKEVSQRRDIEAARAGPRWSARGVSIIFTLVLTGFITLTEFGAQYATPFGQVVLVAVLAAFFACLWWLHWVTVPKPEPRFMITDEEIA